MVKPNLGTGVQQGKLTWIQINASEWKDLKENHNELVTVSAGEELYEHLSQKNGRGWTAVHYVCSLSDKSFLKKIISKLSTTQMNKLLQIQTDITARTPLFYMKTKGSDMLDTEAESISLWSRLTESEKFDLLSIRDIYGNTALHYRACKGYYVSIQKLLQPLSPAHRLELMAFKNNKGQTVIQAAQVSDFSSSKSVDALEAIDTDSKVELLINDKENRKQMGLSDALTTLLKEQPLTMKHVAKLSTYCKQYIIPTNQKRTKMQALVLYNPDEREGAHSEASDMIDSLKAAVFSVQKIEWTSTYKLQELICDKVTGISDSCSVMVVCIMSHGTVGSLRGQDGSMIPLNDILHLITQSLPAQVPLVMMVQACQGFGNSEGHSSSSDMVKVVNPEENKHIVLTRPHTVLLMATVTGGEATRGAYTGALSNQFRQADGKMDIHEMHTNAVDEMMSKFKDNEDQTPEYRDTIKGKKLILPCVKRPDSAAWLDKRGFRQAITYIYNRLGFSNLVTSQALSHQAKLAK